MYEIWRLEGQRINRWFVWSRLVSTPSEGLSRGYWGEDLDVLLDGGVIDRRVVMSRVPRTTLRCGDIVKNGRSRTEDSGKVG